MKLTRTTPVTARLRLLFAAIGAMVSLPYLAGEQSDAHGAVGRVPILELYTAEGCYPSMGPGFTLVKGRAKHDLAVDCAGNAHRGRAPRGEKKREQAFQE